MECNFKSDDLTNWFNLKSLIVEKSYKFIRKSPKNSFKNISIWVARKSNLSGDKCKLIINSVNSTADDKWRQNILQEWCCLHAEMCQKLYEEVRQNHSGIFFRSTPFVEVCSYITFQGNFEMMPCIMFCELHNPCGAPKPVLYISSHFETKTKTTQKDYDSFKNRENTFDASKIHIHRIKENHVHCYEQAGIK